MSAGNGERVTRLIRFTAKGEPQADRFLARLSTVRSSVAEEPGHVSYRVFRSRDKATVCFVLEEWRTRADADAHVARSTDGTDAQAALGLLRGWPDTTTIEEITIPTARTA